MRDLDTFIRESAKKLQPTWTEEERNYWAESLRLAISSATREALSPAMVEALRSVVLTALKGNYARPAPEAMEYQRKVYAWVIGDLVASGLPDAEEAQQLKTQFRQLLDWLGGPMQQQLGVEEPVVTAALDAAAQNCEGKIDQVYYRFDREPLTPEQMTQARALMQEQLDQAQAKLEERVRAAPDERMAVSDRRTAAQALPFGALTAVVRKFCNWRQLPPELAAERDKGTAAQLAASEAGFVVLAVDPLRFLLDALSAGRAVPAGAPPGME